MPDLVSYIRQMLSRGYKLEVIRNYLIKYGYKSDDINYAIGIIYQRKVETPVIEHQHHVHLSKQTILALVFVTFLFLGGLTVIVKEFWIPGIGAEQLLDIETSSQYSSINPGRDLTFNVMVFNLGGNNRYDILLEHTMEDMSGNVVNKKTETIAIETRSSVTSSIKIMDDTQSGSYVLKTVAKYNDQEASASFMFKVADQSIPITTTSTTISGFVTTTSPTQTTNEVNEGPSCFDSTLNQDETGIDCGGVCTPCVKSDTQMSKDLKSLDLEIEKEAYCNELNDYFKRDSCLLKVAFQTQKPRYCDIIVEPKRKDDCFMWFITSYEFEVEGQLICDLLENKQYKETCYMLHDNFY